MKGYPRWITRGKITTFTSFFFLSGLILAPTTLALRLDWEVPWRLSNEARIGVSAVHASLSFLMLIFLGSLLSIHIRIGWKKKTHRISGLSMVLSLLFLALSAIAIYYSGNETLSWSAGVSHLTAGLLFFLFYLGHLLLSTKSRILRTTSRSD